MSQRFCATQVPNLILLFLTCIPSGPLMFERLCHNGKISRIKESHDQGPTTRGSFRLLSDFCLSQEDCPKYVISLVAASVRFILKQIKGNHRPRGD